jgi:hypothetical protein
LSSPVWNPATIAEIVGNGHNRSKGHLCFGDAQKRHLRYRKGHQSIGAIGGLYWEEDQLMPPKEDNTGGFWEHMAIYSFHELLIGRGKKIPLM